MNFRTFSTLQIALGVSIAVHAVLLTVRFVDPEGFNRIFQDTPLEVILVNAKTAEKPDAAKAQAIAQHTLAGGGDAEKGRATTPLPPSALTEIGDATEDAQRKIEAMQEQQMLLLAQLRQQLAMLALDADQPHRLRQFERRREQPAGHRLGHRIGHADAEFEHRLAGDALFAQFGFELVAQAEDLVGITQCHAAGLGEFELAPALAEQLPPQAIFQQLDLARQGLWRGVQLLARAHDAAGFGGDPEIVQVLEVHALRISKFFAK